MVEVIIGFGLLGGLALGVMQLTQTVQKTSKKAVQDLEKTNLIRSISDSVSNSLVCSETFKNLDPTLSPNITDIKSATQNIISIGDEYGEASGVVILTSMQMVNYDAPSESALLRVVVTRKGLQDRTMVGTGAIDAATGRMSTTHNIPIRFRTNAGLIAECYNMNENILRSYCETNLLGVFEDVTGECQSPTLRRDAATNAALTTNIGSVEITSGPTIVNNGNGFLDIIGAMGVGDSPNVRTMNGLNQGDLAVSNRFGVGKSVLASGTGDLTVSSGVGVNIDGDVPNGDIVATGGVKIGTTTLSNIPDGDLIIGNALSNGSTGFSTAALQAASGQIISRNNITIQKNMTNDTNDQYATTIQWVRNRIAYTLSPSATPKNDVAADILNSIYNEDTSGLNVVKSNLCTTTRVRTGLNADATYVSGSWLSAPTSKCLLRPTYCSTNNTCSNVYAINNIFANNGYVRAGTYVQAGSYLNAGQYITSGTYIRAGSYMQATTYASSGTQMQAGSFVQAGTYITAGSYIQGQTVLGQSRVCAGSTGYCYSTLQSGICGGTSIMVGISNGSIVCATRW